MPPQTYHIFVNKTKYETSETLLTGQQVLTLANLSPPEYDLFLVRGEGKGEKVEPDHQVEIKNGLHFNAITKGVNFG